MAERIPRGTWSKHMYDAIKLGVAMQMKAVSGIRSQYLAETEELRLEGITMDRLQRELLRDEPEVQEMLAEQMVPVIQQAIAPPVQEGPVI